MIPNLADLQKKCSDLGLTVKQSGKRPTKDDYVQALRAHFLGACELPYTELEPMLAFQDWNLNPDEAAEIWTSPRWVAEEKFNGCRVVIHLVKGVGVFAHSRTTSLKTYRKQELHQQFVWSEFVPDFDATIDCEAMVEKSIDTRGYTAKGEKTESTLHSTISILHLEPAQAKKVQREQNAPLTFKAFDITSYEGQDLRGMKLEDRRVRLDGALFRLPNHVRQYFRLSAITSGEQAKRALFDKILSEGGEGVMLKNLDGTYEDSSSRRRDGWVKVKRRQEYDAFVSGFDPGDEGKGWEKLVGDITFSVHTEKGEHAIARCSNVTLELRKAMTEIVDGKVQLKREWYGRVAQVSGQDITPRVMRLSHATIDRWRFEPGADFKAAVDCRTSMADLKRASEWAAEK